MMLLPLLVSLLVLGAPAPDEAALKAFERDLRRAARSEGELGATVDAGLRTLRGLDSKALVECLLDTYEGLEKIAADVESRRQKQLEQGAKDRGEIDRIRHAQDRLLARLVQVKKTASREAAGRLALEETGASFTLRLELAKRVSEVCAAPRGLEQGLRRKKVQDLQVALELCHRLGTAAGALVESVTPLLEHEDQGLRVQAARALGRLARPEGVAPMIDALEATSGRDQQALAAALERLTGQPLGRTVGAWRRWWQDHRDAAFAGRLPLGEGEPNVVQVASGYYFGIPQDGTSILYVVDLSNSMKRQLPQATSTRDQKARAELRRAVEALPPERRFNVLVFADRMRTFSDRQVPASARNKKAMGEWLDGLGLELGTNTYGALEMGFALAGRGPKDRWYESAIDTIFLLSDGRPTLPLEGRSVAADNPERILAAVRRWNPLDRVVVHTVSLGKDARGQFMKKLAAQNGGQHVVHTGD